MKHNDILSEIESLIESLPLAAQTGKIPTLREKLKALESSIMYRDRALMDALALHIYHVQQKGMV